MSPSLSPAQRAVVQKQVAQMLDRSQAFRAMAAGERAEIARNTAEIASFMAADPSRTADPYAIGMADEPADDEKQAFRAQGVREGVAAAAALVNKVDFPAFVAELVKGTFHAIVQSSIEQMQAYADLVRNVSMSLNEFRDQNVTENQGRDHLVQRYPNLLQINMVAGAPKVGPKPGAEFAELPNFKSDLGLSDEVSDLDEETIENTLVPAARNDIAQSRQKLLATMVLMGINRIVVTDGKINAKVRFTFSARDTMTQSAQTYDYKNFGTQTVVYDDRGYEREGYERSYDEDGTLQKVTGGNIYTTGRYNMTSQPVVQLTGQSDTYTEAELNAAGQLTGEVSINFKSETFPLERMASTDQIMQLQNAEGTTARGVPANQQQSPAQPAAPAQP